jgi:hypothetical protein
MLQLLKSAFLFYLATIRKKERVLPSKGNTTNLSIVLKNFRTKLNKEKDANSENKLNE